jgi:hypothetical protein
MPSIRSLGNIISRDCGNDGVQHNENLEEKSIEKYENSPSREPCDAMGSMHKVVNVEKENEE